MGLLQYARVNGKHIGTPADAWDHTGPARIAPPAVAEGRVLGAPTPAPVRSNILMAHLGTVGPNMTLLEALQSRQATDALKAMDRAREPARPLDICLQVGYLSRDRYCLWLRIKPV